MAGRFDRSEFSSEETPAQDATATEKLRASVERQVRAVVEEAMARAVAIEDRAQAKANQMEQESQEQASRVLRESQEQASQVLRESEQRAGEVLSGAIQRAEGMLQATNTLEEELGKVIGSFRDEIALLNSELRAARAELSAPPRAAPPAPRSEVVTKAGPETGPDETRGPDTEAAASVASQEHITAGAPSAPAPEEAPHAAADRARETGRRRLRLLRREK